MTIGMADSLSAPRTVQTPSTVQVPTMKTSECAKLMRRSTPYTIV